MENHGITHDQAHTADLFQCKTFRSDLHLARL